ncbi:RNA polymerase sigma factor [Bacteroides thetaiotaomicron]|nr:RNA polymerase sigma factor [Bacteroides thetaiotaomicron]
MEEEFIELINQYQGILQKICNIYFYQHPFREDYYQEILIRLWKAYPKFKQESTVSTWLYRVTLNTAIDLVRKESVQPVYKELSTQEYAIHDSHPEENTATDKKSSYIKPSTGCPK